MIGASTSELLASSDNGLFWPVLVLAPMLTFGGYLFYIYSQLEYITAAMLTQHVPRDGNGAIVVQIGGGSKELFYYPKNTLQVRLLPGLAPYPITRHYLSSPFGCPTLCNR